jgi:hypothetical protein
MAHVERGLTTNFLGPKSHQNLSIGLTLPAHPAATHAGTACERPKQSETREKEKGQGLLLRRRRFPSTAAWRATSKGTGTSMAAEGSRRGLGFRRSGNGRGGKQNGRIRAGEGRRKKNRTAFLAGNRKGVGPMWRPANLLPPVWA